MTDAPLPPTAAGRRILVVDDDRDALRILIDFVESRQMLAIGAHDGHEALARYHDDGPFDAIVLDVMMPGIDGLEVCRRIKASAQGQLTPVLMLSARSDTRSRVAGLYGGADDYLSKPVDLRELAARLDVLLRTRDRYHALAARHAADMDAAIEDSLTGALRGPYFMRRVQEEVSRADRYRVPLVLVVGDVMGLPEERRADPDDSDDVRLPGPADTLIAMVAQTIRAHLRAQDLLARLRRGRFAAVLPHTSRQVTPSLLKRLQVSVASIPIDASIPDSPPAGLSFRVGHAELGPKMDTKTLFALAEPR